MTARLYRRKSEAYVETLAKVEKVVRGVCVVVILYIYGSRCLYTLPRACNLCVNVHDG
jgi:hypothetical protein